MVHNSERQAAVHLHNNHPKQNEKKQVLCSICNQTFPGKKSSITHVNMVHFNYCPFSCDNCEKSFDSISKLRNHIKLLHNDEKNYLCDQCDATFNHHSRLSSHKRWRHTTPSHLPCPQCDKVFQFKDKLRSHVRETHENPQSFVCDECGGIFKSSKTYSDHMKRHTEGNPGQFPCKDENCPKTFSYKNTMLAHHRTIHGEGRPKPKHQCKFCPKMFLSMKRKKEHEDAVHLNVRSFKCELCDYAGTSKIRLRYHIEGTHKGIMYDCDYPGCSKSYNFKGNLYAHRFRVHKIPRPLAKQQN